MSGMALAYYIVNDWGYCTTNLTGYIEDKQEKSECEFQGWLFLQSLWLRARTLLVNRPRSVWFAVRRFYSTAEKRWRRGRWKSKA